MNVQRIIETAASANAVALGNAAASECFRTKMKSMYTVRIDLKDSDKNLLVRMVPFNITFTGEVAISHDHALIAALRELSREIYEKNFKIQNTTERTLVIGSCANGLYIASDQSKL